MKRTKRLLCACGAAAVDDIVCQASETILCVGEAPLDGCGAVLTMEERHLYGSSCENCHLERAHRVRSWHLGGQDEVLAGMFEACSPMPRKRRAA